MRVQLVTGPTTAQEPVSVTDAKEHCRVDTSGEASYFAGLIATARAWAEKFTCRTIAPATFRLWLDEFPACGWIEIPLPPLRSVTSLTYVDEVGVTQTWSAANYAVDLVSEPGRLNLAYGIAWPTPRPQPNAIAVNFTAGYATPGDVPEPIRNAVKLVVSGLYENRESHNPEVVRENFAVKSLLWPYRVLYF